jgi:hypothetical protein
VTTSDRAPPWTFGTRELMKSLAARGLLTAHNAALRFGEDQDMRAARNETLALAALVLCVGTSAADPTITGTAVLGPFTGHDAVLHPDNVSPRKIEYYGTDLGFSYEHRGRLVFLFGDSWATEAYAPIQASTAGRYDDAFGWIDLAEWRDASRITPGHVPPVRIGQNPGTTEASAIDPGARDGSRQDADGGIQQRRARVRRFQLDQATGLPHGRGVRRRTLLRCRAGLCRHTGRCRAVVDDRLRRR